MNIYELTVTYVDGYKKIEKGTFDNIMTTLGIYGMDSELATVEITNGITGEIIMSIQKQKDWGFSSI